LVKMLCFSSLAAVLFALITSIDAYLIPGMADPTPASHNKVNEDWWTPKPTQAPMHFGSVQKRDLFGRQDRDQVCGYVNAIASESAYCGAGYACTYDTDPNYAMCCATNAAGNFIQNCPGATTCENYIGDYSSATPITSHGVVRCPAAYPSCATWIYNGKTPGDTVTYSNYECTDGTDLLFTVYPTANDGNSISPVTSPSSPPSAVISISTTGNSTYSPPTISSYSPPPTPTPHLSDAGAIAGGVVGAIVGIALVAGAVFFLARRKREQREEPVPEISVNTTK